MCKDVDFFRKPITPIKTDPALMCDISLSSYLHFSGFRAFAPKLYLYCSFPTVLFLFCLFSVLFLCICTVFVLYFFVLAL
jgi:hypothetical protein